MKKILSIMTLLSLSFLSSILLAAKANEFIPLTTIGLTQQYCPMESRLIFNPNNLTPNSAGTITGHNQVAFESIPTKTAIHPKNIDMNNLITGVQFRNADGLYGYISNDVVTCLYSYKGFTNTQVAL